MKLNWISPFPPDNSGIAVYSEYLSDVMVKYTEIDRIDRTCSIPDYGINIYSMGNHPFHDLIYTAAINKHGIVFMHDINLHDLIYFRTAGRGKKVKYIQYLLNEKCISDNDIKVLLYKSFPEKRTLFESYNLINEIVLKNNYFIVHSRMAEQTIKEINKKANILRIRHFSLWHNIKKEAVSNKGPVIIGIFGYLSRSKKIEEILAVYSAFRKESMIDTQLRIVGNDADINTEDIIQKHELSKYIKLHRDTDNDEFHRLLSEIDYGIGIREPYHGEVSGNIIKMMSSSIPVAFNGAGMDIPKNAYFNIEMNRFDESLMNYFKLIERKSAILSEIGHNAYEFIEKECNADHIARSITAFAENYNESENTDIKHYSKFNVFSHLTLRDKCRFIIRRDI